MSILKIDNLRPSNTNSRDNFSAGNKSLNKSGVFDYRIYSSPNRIHVKEGNLLFSNDVFFLDDDNKLKDRATTKELTINDSLFGIGNIVQPLSFPPSFNRYF
jgi:hypothetical protein